MKLTPDKATLFQYNLSNKQEKVYEYEEIQDILDIFIKEPVKEEIKSIKWDIYYDLEEIISENQKDLKKTIKKIEEYLYENL